MIALSIDKYIAPPQRNAQPRSIRKTDYSFFLVYSEDALLSLWHPRDSTGVVRSVRAESIDVLNDAGVVRSVRAESIDVLNDAGVVRSVRSESTQPFPGVRSQLAGN